MKAILRTAFAAAAVAVSAHVSAQVTFFENEGFHGRTFTTQSPVNNFSRKGFNDRASSAIVLNGCWEVCEDARFSGRRVVLRAGRYPSLGAMGLNDRVSPVRAMSRDARVDDDRYAPVAVPVYDDHRRGNERLYEADVTSVHAVMAPPEQRCWVEREQVTEDRNSRIPGAIVGAIIGGVLGHQVGGCAGKDIATAGGAVAGAAVGADVARNRGGQQTHLQDVQKCSTKPAQARSDYGDVTYNSRGIGHRVQMVTAPGRTVTVNRQGEPRA
jgi:uncharacterized protein YcfJ